MRPRRVLIIEDNDDAAEILALWLERAGHEVRIAGSGEEGVAIAAEWTPEVVLSDIGLPGAKDGYAVARALRASGAKAPFLVALSGYDRQRDKVMAREAGFDAYVTKPIQTAELDRLIASRESR